MGITALYSYELWDLVIVPGWSLLIGVILIIEVYRLLVEINRDTYDIIVFRNDRKYLFE